MMSFVPGYQVGEDAVLAALKSSNAAGIAKYFDETVDIKLPEKEESKNIGRRQASIMLTTFYGENNISGFILGNQREMGGTKYITGKINGHTKNYNITVMMRVSGSSATILSLRIN